MLVPVVHQNPWCPFQKNRKVKCPFDTTDSEWRLQNMRGGPNWSSNQWDKDYARTVFGDISVNWIKWLIWSIMKWHNLEIAAWNPLKPWKTMGHWGTEGPNARRFCPPKNVHICGQNAGPIPRQRTEASQSFQEGMDTKTWLIPPNNHWNRIIIDRLLTRIQLS